MLLGSGSGPLAGAAVQIRSAVADLVGMARSPAVRPLHPPAVEGGGLPENPPAAVAYRAGQPELTRAVVLHLGGAIVVHGAGRREPAASGLPVPRPRTAALVNAGPVTPGPARAGSAGDLHDRVRGWWPLGEILDRWAGRPFEAPRLLLGLTGPADRLWVYAAVALDPCGWTDCARGRDPDGLVQLPTLTDPAGPGPITDPTIDHLRLRGCGALPGEFFAGSSPLDVVIPG
jgi:hypothetical protein